MCSFLYCLGFCIMMNFLFSLANSFVYVCQHKLLASCFTVWTILLLYYLWLSTSLKLDRYQQLPANFCGLLRCLYSYLTIFLLSVMNPLKFIYHFLCYEILQGAQLFVIDNFIQAGLGHTMRSFLRKKKQRGKRRGKKRREGKGRED